MDEPGEHHGADGIYATCVLNGSEDSQYLEGTNFGFAIPSTATIDGIEVTIVRYASHSISDSVTDEAVQIIKGGSVQTQNEADTVDLWPSAPATDGSSTDLWGTTWTPAQINGSNFGFALIALADGDATVYVDYMTVSVFYSSGGSVVADAVAYASHSVEIRTEGAFRQVSGVTGVYGKVGAVVGDLPRLAPSGLEQRAVQLFVKPSRGDLNVLPDSGLDGMTVKVIYRPVYGHRP
jgi:hypothetical protein